MKKYIEVINKPLHFISIFIFIASFMAIIEFNPSIYSGLLIIYSIGVVAVFMTEYYVCKMINKKKEKKKEVKTKQVAIFVTFTIIEGLVTCIASSLVFTFIRMGGIL